MGTAINNNIYTAGRCRIFWRRMFSVPKEVKKAYKEMSGQRFSSKAMRTDPSLFPWTAAGPLLAASELEKEEVPFATINREAVSVWSQKLTSPRNFEADFNYLLETEDFHLAVISPDTSQEAAEIIDLLHNPLGGVAAYKIKDEIIVLANHNNLLNALHASKLICKIDILDIKKGENTSPRTALSSVARKSQTWHLPYFAEKIECERFIDELTEHSIVSRRLLPHINPHQFVTIKGKGKGAGKEWSIQCYVLQDSMWQTIIEPKNIVTMETRDFGMPEVLAEGLPTLYFVELRECVKTLEERSRANLQTHIQRLKDATNRLREKHPEKLIKINLKPGQRFVFVGDIHQNVENLRRVFFKYEKELAQGKVILVFLGDYIHESGIHENTNLHSATQSHDSIDHLLKKYVEEYPDAIIPFRGNHDLVLTQEIELQKEGVLQKQIFLKTTRYLRGEEYLESLDAFFEALPYAGVFVTPSGKCIFAAHSFTNSDFHAQELAASVNGLLGGDIHATKMLSGVTKFKYGEDNIYNANNILIGRDYLDEDSLLIPNFINRITGGLDYIFFGHTYFEGEKDADCCLIEEFIYGRNKTCPLYVLQSFLDQLTVIEVNENGEATKVTL